VSEIGEENPNDVNKKEWPDNKQYEEIRAMSAASDDFLDRDQLKYSNTMTP